MGMDFVPGGTLQYDKLEQHGSLTKTYENRN